MPERGRALRRRHGRRSAQERARGLSLPAHQSLFANFFHHVHSFQDEVWKATLAADPAVDAAIGQAVAPSFTAPDEKESRAFETLADTILGAAAHQNAAGVEITRVERTGADAIYLVRSPEPIVPARTEIALSRSERALPSGEAPENIKLTAAGDDVHDVFCCCAMARS